MRRWLWLGVLLLLPAWALGDPVSFVADVEITGQLSVTTFVVPAGASPPDPCVLHSLYRDTTATTGQQLKVCTQASPAVWTVQGDGGGSGGGAPTNAHYVTTQAETGLEAESNLGTLNSGVLAQSVSGGVSTPSAISSTTVGQVLRVTGSNTFAFGAVDLADTDAVTNALPAANVTAAGSAGQVQINATTLGGSAGLTLDANGITGERHTCTSVSTNTAVSTRCSLVDTTSGDVTLTLPNAAMTGGASALFHVWKVSSDAHQLILAADTGDTLNYATQTYSTTRQGAGFAIEEQSGAASGNWHVRSLYVGDTLTPTTLAVPAGASPPDPCVLHSLYRDTSGTPGQQLKVCTQASPAVWTLQGDGGGGSGDVLASGTLTANRLMLGGGTTVVTALGSLGTTAQVLHGNAGGAPSFTAVVPGDFDFSADITTANATETAHGLLPKLGGGTTNFLRADGTWTLPSACSTCTTNAAALTANRLVLGGGANAAAVLGSLGTTTQVLHGNAAGAPTWGAIVAGDLDLSSDVTTANASLTAHGLLPKLGGGTVHFLRADGIWSGPGTGTVQLNVNSSLPPASNPAELSNAQIEPALLFDDTTSECAYWVFTVPPDYVELPVFQYTYTMMSDTNTGHSLNFDVTLDKPSGPNTDSYAAANACNDAAIPAAVTTHDTVACALTTTDSLAAGDLVKLRLCLNTSGTATGDAAIRGAVFTYAK